MNDVIDIVSRRTKEKSNVFWITWQIIPRTTMTTNESCCWCCNCKKKNQKKNKTNLARFQSHLPWPQEYQKPGGGEWKVLLHESSFVCNNSMHTKRRVRVDVSVRISLSGIPPPVGVQSDWPTSFSGNTNPLKKWEATLSWNTVRRTLKPRSHWRV